MRSVSPPAWSLLPPLSSLIIPVSLLILGASLAEAQISSDINYYLQYTDGLKTMWTESLKSLYQLSQNFILTITGKGLSETVLKGEVELFLCCWRVEFVSGLRRSFEEILWCDSIICCNQNYCVQKLESLLRQCYKFILFVFKKLLIPICFLTRL